MNEGLTEKIFLRVTLETVRTIEHLMDKTGYKKAEIVRYFFLKGLQHEKDLPMPELSQPDPAKHTRKGKTQILA